MRAPTLLARALLWVTCATVFSTPLAAQQPQARASIDLNPVGVNQVFTLSLEVSGVQRLDGDPSVPSLSTFAQYLGSSSSTNLQMVNGRTSVSLTIEYRFLAQREGSHEIPAIEVPAGGLSLTTEPIVLTVSATPQQPSRPSAGGADQPTVGPEDLFIVATADKSEVFENEPLVVEYRIYTRVNIESFTILSPPSVEGFWVEEIPLADGPVAEQVTRNGVQYTSAVLRRAVLFPTGAGTRTIEPINVEARARVQRRRGLLDDFFGSGLLGGVIPVNVTSDPIDIQVRPLPSAGRPENFTGVVGSLDVDAEVDRTELEANDAVTLTIRVDGEGNLRGLAPPELGLDADFEVFDPEVTENITRTGGVIRGSKAFEYVLIPRAPGVREIPAIELAYFDAGAERYAVSTAPAISLEVAGGASPTLTGAALRSGVETLREDIRFIRLGSPMLRRSGRRIHDTSAFWLTLLLPFVAAGGALALRAHRDRMEGDVAYARDRRAGRVARKRLATARALVDSQEGATYYGEVAGALRGFLADKLNLPEAGLMTASVSSTLRKRGVEPSVADEYLACLEHCDLQRFAPGPSEAGARAEFLKRAEEAMTALNKELAG